MSIFPATDLVIDVARAADPQRRAAAVRRLTEMSAPSAPARSPIVGGPRTGALAYKPIATSVARIEPKASPAEQAARKFEAFLIQGWIEMLLPKESSGAFGVGVGVGSGVWRSMLAEQIASQLTKADAFGLHHHLTPRNEEQSTPHKNEARRV